MLIVKLMRTHDAEERKNKRSGSNNFLEQLCLKFVISEVLMSGLWKRIGTTGTKTRKEEEF